jgi:hypothetical protein
MGNTTKIEWGQIDKENHSEMPYDYWPDGQHLGDEP